MESEHRASCKQNVRTFAFSTLFGHENSQTGFSAIRLQKNLPMVQIEQKNVNPKCKATFMLSFWLAQVQNTTKA